MVGARGVDDGWVGVFGYGPLLCLLFSLSRHKR